MSRLLCLTELLRRLSPPRPPARRRRAEAAGWDIAYRDPPGSRVQVPRCTSQATIYEHKPKIKGLVPERPRRPWSRRAQPEQEAAVGHGRRAGQEQHDAVDRRVDLLLHRRAVDAGHGAKQLTLPHHLAGTGPRLPPTRPAAVQPLEVAQVARRPVVLPVR